MVDHRRLVPQSCYRARSTRRHPLRLGVTHREVSVMVTLTLMLGCLFAWVVRCRRPTVLHAVRGSLRVCAAFLALVVAMVALMAALAAPGGRSRAGYR